jgi:NAD(P)H-hydrate epimerase
MTPALTRAEVRALDHRAIHEFGVPGIVLMENAGRSSAELLVSLGIPGPVVICCGKGNNGGDGFVIARHLDNRGVPVQVLLFARPEELHGDARTNFDIVAKTGLPLSFPAGDAGVTNALASAGCIVDALYGTGLQGPVKPPHDRVIEAINRSGVKVLAVDVPSGLDSDTGRPLGATIQANHTATFIANKIGFTLPGADRWTGQVHVLDIGMPRQVYR